jgi:hypothetical protein
MQLLNIGRVRDHLGQSPLVDDPLWACESHKVQSRDLTMFVARWAAREQGPIANTAIGVLQAEAIKDIVRGRLGGTLAWLDYRIDQPRFMADELVDGLARLPLPRRGACLFALEAKMGLQDVADLTWKDVPHRTEIPQTGLCQEVLRAQPRHIRLSYVFWEEVGPRVAAPLLELDYSVKMAFACAWHELQENYDAMLMVDRQADAVSLLEIAGEIRRGEL